MDSKSGELRFLTRLSDEKYKWKNRCNLVWESECGKIIHGSKSHDFYVYHSQVDYDKGYMAAFYKSLGEAKRFFILEKLRVD